MSDSTIFNGGESPLAAKATGATTSLVHGQTGPSQSDGGSAPDPSSANFTGAAATGSAENSEIPLGGVMIAR